MPRGVAFMASPSFPVLLLAGEGPVYPGQSSGPFSPLGVPPAWGDRSVTQSFLWVRLEARGRGHEMRAPETGTEGEIYVQVWAKRPLEMDDVS